MRGETTGLHNSQTETQGKASMKRPFYVSIRFNHSLDSFGCMLEVFCEGNHCDQYIPSIGGSFAQCLMVQRELFRVGNCPLQYDKIAAKVNQEAGTNSHNDGKSEPRRKKGFNTRSK